MARPVVVLPLPDSPTRPSTSPGMIARLTSSTARNSVTAARWNNPPRNGNVTFKPTASTRRAAATGPVLSTGIVMPTGSVMRRVCAGHRASGGSAPHGPAVPARSVARRGGRSRWRAGSAARRRNPAARRRRSAPCPGSPRGDVQDRGRPPARAECWRAARRYRGAAGARIPRRPSPCSTMRPAYITATRSAISATTPRLCVMNSTLMPAPPAGRASDRGSAPGSSRPAPWSVRRRSAGRAAGQRHGDHHALAHAAGQPVRILQRARSRIRNIDPRQHIDGMTPRRAPGQARDAGAPPRRSARPPSAAD